MNLNTNLINKSVLENRIKQLSKRYAKTTSFCTRTEEIVTENDKTTTINICKVSKKNNSQFDPLYNIKKGYISDIGTFENVEVSSNNSNTIFITPSSIDKVTNKKYKEVFEEKYNDTNNKYFYGFNYNSIDKTLIEDVNSDIHKNISMKEMYNYENKGFIGTMQPDNLPILNGQPDSSGYIAFEQNDVVKNYLYNINKNKFFINPLFHDKSLAPEFEQLKRTVFPRLDPRCFKTDEGRDYSRMYFINKTHKFNYPISITQNVPESLSTVQAYYRSSNGKMDATMIDINNSNGGTYSEGHTRQLFDTLRGHKGTYWEWHSHTTLTNITKFTKKDEVVSNTSYDKINQRCLNYHLNKTINTLMNWRKNYSNKTGGPTNYFGIKTSKKISNIHELYTFEQTQENNTVTYKDGFRIIVGTMQGALVGVHCGDYRENDERYVEDTSSTGHYEDITHRFHYYMNDRYNPRYILGFRYYRIISDSRDRTYTSNRFYSKLPIGKIKKFNNITNFLTDTIVKETMQSVRNVALADRVFYDAFVSDGNHVGMGRNITGISFKSFEDV